MSGITNTKVFGIYMTSSWGTPSPSSAETAQELSLHTILLLLISRRMVLRFICIPLFEGGMDNVCSLSAVDWWTLQKPWYLNARLSFRECQNGQDLWSSTNVNAVEKGLCLPQPARFHSGNISQMDVNFLILSQKWTNKNNKTNQPIKKGSQGALWCDCFITGIVFWWNIWKLAVNCSPRPPVRMVPIEKEYFMAWGSEAGYAVLVGAYLFNGKMKYKGICGHT